MPVRTFITEGPVQYARYRFGYCQWAEIADVGDVDKPYAGGYLPYSADVNDPRHLFYMARSLRIRMDRYSVDKKRRYDHRNWQLHNLERTCLRKEAFLDAYGPKALSLAAEWMETRFGSAFIGPARLAYILGKPFLSDVLIWRTSQELMAFALLARGAWGAHYWYVFYKNNQAENLPPGHGYLVDFLNWTREVALPYAYLGTGYGQKSRYKARGLTGLEFWDGSAWNANKDTLISLQENDPPEERPNPNA